MTGRPDAAWLYAHAAKRRSVVLLWASCACCLAVGCGGPGLDVAPVEGVVTLDGTPVDKAGVIFQPELGPVATAVTDEEGRFRLTTGKLDGALVGEHRIVVSKGGVDAGGAAGGAGDPLADPVKKRFRPKSRLPIRYARASTSELVETVKRGERNTVELHLTTKEP